MTAFARHPKLLALVLIAAAAVVGGVVYLSVTGDWLSTPADPPAVAESPPPPDPREAFPTPYRNVKPGVRYVGDAACAPCHQDIDKSYHQHPMGRSAAVVKGSPPVERFDAAARNLVASGPYTLRAVPSASGVTHHISAKDADGRPLPEYVVAADVAIGSGTRGRSYLTVDRGAAWQSPLSWFGPEQRWDVSPGFDLGNGSRRAVISECLFCHVDRVEPVPHTRNTFTQPLPTGQAAIGCERCHGPGELHVAERAGGVAPAGADLSIVNPKHLSPELRSAVCEQCHLQGQERVTRRGRDVWEYRPGLPFDQFVSVFTRHPDLAEAHQSVGQYEQMEQSRCFVASAGKLGCVSCHDPHALPPAEAKAAYYRTKCLTCHETKGCNAPAADRQARADSCVACHMPRGDSTNIVHASVTDHRVPRKPVPAAARRGLDPDALPLLPFRVGPHAPPAAERDRDYGLALAKVAGNIPPTVPARQRVADAALDRLTSSLRAWPTDHDALLGLTVARAAAGDGLGRLEAARAAVAQDGRSELALAELTEAALAAGRLDEADEAAGKWAAANPSAVEPGLARAAVRLLRKDWAAAEAECRAVLATHPLLPQARRFLAVCKHHRGDPAGGRKEAETAATLLNKPAQRPAVLEWYDRQTR